MGVLALQMNVVMRPVCPLPTLPRKRERALPPANEAVPRRLHNRLPLPLAGEGWGGGSAGCRLCGPALGSIRA